jgi:hypothetical protein
MNVQEILPDPGFTEAEVLQIKELVKNPLFERYLKSLGANSLLDGLVAEQVFTSQSPEQAVLRQGHRSSFAQGVLSIVSHLVDLSK